MADAGKGAVIEADEGDILRYGHVKAVELLHQQQGNIVVITDDSVHIIGNAVKKAPPRFLGQKARLVFSGKPADAPVVYGQTRCLQRRDISLVTKMPLHVVAFENAADAPKTMGKQRIGREPSAALVVCDDMDVLLKLRVKAIDKDHWNIAFPQALIKRDVWVG